MEKPASTDYPIADLLRRRWSPRAFSERAVEEEKLLYLFEAARWAPSCFNDQPWRFIVARREDGGAYERLLLCLVDGNRIWAQRAPVLVLSVAKLAFDHNGKPNRHAFHDVGMAALSLALQATEMGLRIHQMAGFDEQAARAAFAVPDGFEPAAAIAIGYPGAPESLPEELRSKEGSSRTRKRLSELVFGHNWGSAASWLGSSDQ